MLQEPQILVRLTLYLLFRCAPRTAPLAEEKDKKKEEEKNEEWKTPEDRRNAFREDRDVQFL